jgi:tRNA G18 (ribose-2'-O)-methylase SpoU
VESVSEPREVDDPADPRLADYVDLTDSVLRRRIEGERGFFIAESPLVVQRLLASDHHVRSVLVTPERYDALADALSRRADVPVYVAPAEVLRRVVGFHLHRGVVAAADRPPLPEPAAVLRGARRIAVLQKLNDHENLGLIFRSAAALGIDAVLLDAECSDPLYRRCVRVSIGHVLTLPWTRIAALDEMSDAGFRLYALTPDSGAEPIASVTWAERSALLFGAEGPGLSDAWLARADARVQIPMQPGADSLNVATAASIAFYEAVR